MFGWFKRLIGCDWISEIEGLGAAKLKYSNNRLSCEYTDLDGPFGLTAVPLSNIIHFSSPEPFLRWMGNNRTVNTADILVDTLVPGDNNYRLIDGWGYENGSVPSQMTIVMVFSSMANDEDMIYSVTVTKKNYKQILSFIKKEVKLVDGL